MTPLRNTIHDNGQTIGHTTGLAKLAARVTSALAGPLLDLKCEHQASSDCIIQDQLAAVCHRRLVGTGEATQNQHRLGSNGVDHVTNFLVVKRELDELRDLNVIDGDFGLAPRCDEQVLLLRPLQF
jgi:hypothetical protein